MHKTYKLCFVCRMLNAKMHINLIPYCTVVLPYMAVLATKTQFVLNFDEKMSLLKTNDFAKFQYRNIDFLLYHSYNAYRFDYYRDQYYSIT